MVEHWAQGPEFKVQYHQETPKQPKSMTGLFEKGL
jgi:hypothetical protein